MQGKASATNRLESFADLMNDVDDLEESKQVVETPVSTDLTAQMRSAKYIGRVRTNNRIGTVLPDAFLGEVMSRRENEIDELENNNYFEVQRDFSKPDNTPSQQDFMDSFFTSNNQPEEKKPAIKSEASHNSFEIVDDDYSATYMPDISTVNKTVETTTTTNQKEDTSQKTKEEIIL